MAPQAWSGVTWESWNLDDAWARFFTSLWPSGGRTTQQGHRCHEGSALGLWFRSPFKKTDRRATDRVSAPRPKRLPLLVSCSERALRSRRRFRPFYLAFDLRCTLVSTIDFASFQHSRRSPFPLPLSPQQTTVRPNSVHRSTPHNKETRYESESRPFSSRPDSVLCRQASLGKRKQKNRGLLGTTSGNRPLLEKPTRPLPRPRLPWLLGAKMESTPMGG